MIHYVSLDTNIYRHLGIDFWNKIDFKNLNKFLDQRSYEIIMTDVVYKELIDYYSNEVLKPLIADYTKASLKMGNTPLFGKISVADTTPNEQRAKKEYIQTLKKSCFNIVSNYVIDTDELIEFLINNKHETKKDNTRDFLIFKTLLSFAIENPKDKIILISNDKIFTENHFFQRILKKLNIKNLIVLDGIASYLNKFGFKFDFLTDELVLQSIKTEVIEQEILNDIKCLPSYIIKDYNNLDIVPDLQECKIDEIKIYEYYPYLDENDKLKIAISILVRIIAVFSPDNNKDYRNYNIEKYYEENRNRIDQFNRPVYDNFVLFIFEGNLNKSTKKINRLRFIDFIPDYNIKNSYA